MSKLSYIWLLTICLSILPGCLCEVVPPPGKLPKETQTKDEVCPSGSLSVTLKETIFANLEIPRPNKACPGQHLKLTFTKMPENAAFWLYHKRYNDIPQQVFTQRAKASVHLVRALYKPYYFFEKELTKGYKKYQILLRPNRSSITGDVSIKYEYVAIKLPGTHLLDAKGFLLNSILNQEHQVPFSEKRKQLKLQITPNVRQNLYIRTYLFISNDRNNTSSIQIRWTISDATGKIKTHNTYTYANTPMNVENPLLGSFVTFGPSIIAQHCTKECFLSVHIVDRIGRSEGLHIAQLSYDLRIQPAP